MMFETPLKEVKEEQEGQVQSFISFVEEAEALNKDNTDKSTQESIRVKLDKVKKLWLKRQQ